MAPKFGTSGLRGLVTELTPDLIAAHVGAFASACACGGKLYIGQDLRSSSPRIAGTVGAAARAAGLESVDCGALPTPALALAAMQAGAAAVMVTGSHIPADRNGLKFYSADGEITKADEAAILAALDRPAMTAPLGAARTDPAADRFAARYIGAFGPLALKGRRIGVWQQSSVARDLLVAVLEGLGAKALPLDRSESFIPVDTEAVDADTRTRIAAWVREHGLDALVSTDGDGDRPLLADDTGALVPGDVLGQIASAWLGAEVVVTPVSSNTGAEAGGRFARVLRTRIGSPHVIAAMQAALAEAPGAKVAGYEANGGYLLGFAAQGPGGPLAPLPTRDSLLPMLAALAAADGPLSARLAEEPSRFTAADRLQEVAPDRSTAFLATLDTDPAARAAFLSGLAAAPEATIDRTDGLRLHLTDGTVLHLRPSGNAPEFRVYVEADSPERARGLLARGLAALEEQLAR